MMVATRAPELSATCSNGMVVVSARGAEDGGGGGAQGGRDGRGIGHEDRALLVGVDLRGEIGESCVVVFLCELGLQRRR